MATDYTTAGVEDAWREQDERDAAAEQAEEWWYLAEQIGETITIHVPEEHFESLPEGLTAFARVHQETLADDEEAIAIARRTGLDPSALTCFAPRLRLVRGLLDPVVVATPETLAARRELVSNPEAARREISRG